MCRETVQERYERGRIPIAASGPTKLDFRELRKGSRLEEERKVVASYFYVMIVKSSNEGWASMTMVEIPSIFDLCITGVKYETRHWGGAERLCQSCSLDVLVLLK
jgi:hypothetical protein